ncbi:MAG TPA: sigma 54-interacting transcriptional regulator [Spirochaetia bacterium]|nr:sigma 54-interacting transcriptional regulator [Spirochaetia bacterium]
MKQTLRPRGDELSLLFEISQILDSSLNLRSVLEPVLEALARSMKITFATVTLLNRQTREISIESSYGLSAGQNARGRYRLGEGVTGKVIQAGKVWVVPRVSREREFLNRTGARPVGNGDMSFVCVPITIDTEVIGALSIDRPVASSARLHDDARLLSIIASLIAQAVRLRQSSQEERQRLLEENRRLQDELDNRLRPSNIVGNSRAMQDVYQLIARVSRSDVMVFLRGESGTGKELVARAIHSESERASRPFIKVNCAARPSDVVERELFGSEKEAGGFELAHGGTLFLSEIAAVSASVQLRFLRALTEGAFARGGGGQTITPDVRVIASTSRDLEKLIHDGLFRPDLYYRVNVFAIHIPPLRERRTDILLLADYFAERYGKLNRKSILRISTPAIDLLTAYHWPGNVRELENCIERAVLLSDDDVIHGHHFPPSLQTAESSGTAFGRTGSGGGLATALENLEKELLLEALKSSRGNMAAAARALGITTRVMASRVQAFEIEPKRFKSS